LSTCSLLSPEKLDRELQTAAFLGVFLGSTPKFPSRMAARDRLRRRRHDVAAERNVRRRQPARQLTLEPFLPKAPAKN
jgi:hypothetical protein